MRMYFPREGIGMGARHVKILDALSHREVWVEPCRSSTCPEVSPVGPHACERAPDRGQPLWKPVRQFLIKVTNASNTTKRSHSCVFTQEK